MRYDWPRDLAKSTDLRVGREAFNQGFRDALGIPHFGDWLDQLRALLAARANAPGPWLPLGPSALLRGQASGSPMVAGRVRELFVNREGTRAYAASANGGIWYWHEDHGAWRPVGAWGIQPGMVAAGERAQLSLTVGAMHVEFGRTGDVDDPAGDVVYAGTGELRPGLAASPGGKHGGVGVLKLEDTIDAVLAAQGGIPWEAEGTTQMLGKGIYRLARNPGFAVPGNPIELVAATSDGLYFRSGNFAAGGDWQEVPRSKFDHDDDDKLVFTDALWSSSSGLWVGLVTSSGDEGLYHAPNGPEGNFNEIDLDDLYGGSVGDKRLALCEPPGVTNRIYVLGKRKGGGVGHSGLWRVNISGASVTPHLVADVPRGLFASKKYIKDKLFGLSISRDQSHYDMAIAVDPDTDPGKDTVYVGGAFRRIGANGVGDASLHKLTVEAHDGGFRADFDPANEVTPDADDTFAGAGIHADVHQLRVRPNGLWVACDGGVFLRRPDGTARHVNLGLAVTEPGYIDSHPKLDGSLLAGLQDNAVMQKTGDTVWHRRTSGDGGGVAYHPKQPRKFMEQYTNADWGFLEAHSETSWSRSDGTMTAPKFEDEEDTWERSFFYSKAATAEGPTDTTGADPVEMAQVCIGTDRLWYTQDWGKGSAPKWVTIPSGDDPDDAIFFGAGQDKIEKFRVVRFAAAGTERVLNGGAKVMDGATILGLSYDGLYRFQLTVDGNEAKWTKKGDALISGDRPKEKYAEDDLPAAFLKYLPKPPGLAFTDVASHGGARGSCYVTTTGKTKRPDGGGPPEIVEKYDTLWWYDGDGRWYPTGLLTQPVDAAGGTAGARASAHSVIVDPDGVPDFDDPGSMADPNRHDHVYVGTKLGVWRGRLTFAEVPPDPADPDAPRWRPSWNWEPFFDGLPQTLVEDLSIYRETRPAFGGLGPVETKLLRAALVSRGVWELDISPAPDSVGRPYLRTFQLDTGRRPIPVQDTNIYTGSTSLGHEHAYSPDLLAWNYERRADVVGDHMQGRVEVTEPDTFNRNVNTRTTRHRRLYRTRLDAGGPANIAEVLVHHRVLQAIDPNDVTVHLFAWTNRPATPMITDSIEDMPMSAAERAAILTVVEGNPIPPAVAATLRHLGAEHPVGPVDARMPRPARFEFDLDYNFDPANSLAASAITPQRDFLLLIAVVDTPGHRITADDLSPPGIANPTLVDITRRCALIAASTHQRQEEQP